LTIAGARVSGVDYLAMGTTAISATSPGEFYAGANSTSTGANVILTAAPAAVTRYWKKTGVSTDIWDATNTTNWSASAAAGGATGASVPTSADTVIFDSNASLTAYTVTCTATQLRCASLTMAGPASGNVTWAGTAPLAIHGNVTLPATGMTRTYTGGITLTGNTSGKTFTTNGQSIGSIITVNGYGCDWSLNGPLTSTAALNITAGTFRTANSNCSFAGVTFSANYATKALYLGTSTVTNSGFISSNNAYNFIFDAGTSTINMTGDAVGVSGSFGYTFNNLNFTNTNPIQTPAFTINPSCTFANLSVSGRTSSGVSYLQLGADQTITGTLTVSAGTNPMMRTCLTSAALSGNITRTITLTCAAVATLTDVDFRDIVIAGGAVSGGNLTGTRLGDCGGNSGITFDPPKTVYWASTTTGSWNSTSWATSIGGGASNNNFPLSQDTAVFPSAYPNSGSTISISNIYNLPSIDMYARISNTIILSTSNLTLPVFGSWVNGTGTTITGTGALGFVGRGAQTITSAGKTFPQDLDFNLVSGSVTLLDSLSTSSTLTLVSGTFNASTFNVSLTSTSNAAGFIASGTSNRTLGVGSGTWTIASGTTAWNITATGTVTVTGSATINLTSASAKTFVGNTLNYSGITLNQAGAGALSISGNNTFGNITNTYGATGATTINFANTITTVSQFTAAGTAGNILTIRGTSAAAPATIITAGAIDSNYLAVNNVKAYATASTWYAGPNSTNGGTLGWIFSAAPLTAYTRSFGWIIT
jgi:hypothetical protein